MTNVSTLVLKNCNDLRSAYRYNMCCEEDTRSLSKQPSSEACKLAWINRDFGTWYMSPIYECSQKYIDFVNKTMNEADVCTRITECLDIAQGSGCGRYPDGDYLSGVNNMCHAASRRYPHCKLSCPIYYTVVEQGPHRADFDEIIAQRERTAQVSRFDSAFDCIFPNDTVQQLLPHDKNYGNPSCAQGWRFVSGGKCPGSYLYNKSLYNDPQDLVDSNVQQLYVIDC